MKLWVLRHGETEYNHQDRVMGNLDIPLNEDGKKQALSRREEIASAQIDLIICSPKKRTLETAQLAAPNIPIIFDERLLSRDHGEFSGMKSTEYNQHEYWNIHLNQQYERAESVRHIFDRVGTLLEEIKEKYEDKNVLIVTHSGVTRCVYYYFNGIPEDGDLFGYQSLPATLEVYEY